MLVDSHCHLNYLEDPIAAVHRAAGEGVSGILCVGVDQAGSADVLELASRIPQVWASVGQHPEAAGADTGWIEGLLGQPGVVAVGETGLDYHHTSEPEARALQRRDFERQLGIAAAAGLPVIVHTRSAERDTLSLLEAFPDVRGVLHCFTESWQLAAAALELGYYISISGIVTFRNGENVRDVARRVPEDRLLLETDAPWLAPVPHRGKRNEPAFVRETAASVAALRETSLEALGAITTANFFALFERARGALA